MKVAVLDRRQILPVDMAAADATRTADPRILRWSKGALPGSAPPLSVAIVTKGAGRNYPQHLWFALHAHGAYFAILAITVLLDLLRVDVLSSFVSTLGTLFIIGYAVIAFRTAYGGGWWLAAGRAAFVLVMSPSSPSWQSPG